MKKTNSHTDRPDRFGKCPICSAEYGQTPFRVIDERDGQSRLHVTCTQCATSLFVVVHFGQYGMVTYGMPTDLLAHEVSELTLRDPISMDEVIDVHECLKKFTGSTKYLLSS